MNILSIIDKLKSDEGFRSHPYLCSRGKPTIGFGTTFILTKYGRENVTLDWPEVTKEQALYWLHAHVSLALTQAKGFVSNFDDLNEKRQAALVNMAYQLGTRQNQFKKAKAAIESRLWATAYRELLDSDWAKQTPNRAKRVARAFVA